MNCEGCGYAFESEREIFGGIGQAFCSDCWFEEQELIPLREPLEHERRDLQKQMAEVESEMDAIEDKQYFQEEYGAQQKHMVAFDLDTRRAALFFRLSDIQDELDSYTVAYQRRFSVIGRAA